MKKILIAFLLFSIKVNSQTVLPTDSTGKIIYSKVITVDGVGKSELYTRAREWFAKTYNSSKEVIQVDDKEAGKLFGKAILLNYNIAGDVLLGHVEYNISVALKEGKYKYDLTDFYFVGSPNGYGSCSLSAEKTPRLTKSQWVKVKEQTSERAETLIASLEKSMSSKVTSSDW